MFTLLGVGALVKFLRTVLHHAGRLSIFNVIELLNFIDLVKDFKGFLVIAFSFAEVLLVFEENISQVEVAVGEIGVEQDSNLVC